ncbi:MAG: 50S ribosomal protein L3 [Candidatus Yanofskybacteria bacterium RIFCSPHIGHO2_01_FULL_39_8b]|uniref:Large ribosomal subunit protein uL3 n=1 Tax=Candidatus Yanofskybacteria bacterium RIFCSPHIGHO2_01_FULL_39_8b TaxID=1802659 RepID=A0A1F8E911_9BACT|nr:MAG: 50S ribosomal protein L3 [Candidatus Yanofskybacteria bacterium RIFCSPHIGHO2_01_FULL_39_8b]
MKFILGKKLGMSQIYDEKGEVIPVTVIEAEPNTVLQVKTKEKDKYEAVQVGFGTRKEKNINKQQRGHFKGLGNFAVLKEFRFDSKGKISRGQEQEMMDSANLTVGQKIDVSVFTPGDAVKVIGMTKGKGFQGVVKRHGFHGMPFSHGHHSVLRHAGSIGQRFPQHTLKGMRMAGRMGYDKLTVRGLKIVNIDKENNLIAIRGAVPGNRGGLVAIESQ